MGSNLGHLANLKLFIDHAVAKGHTVSLAVRELQNVATVLDPTSIQLFQAPLIRHSRIPSQSPTISFTQLIQRQVFADHHELTGLYLAWQSIFDTVAPDLVIYEHAPSALVASLHREWQKWAVGSGFMVPRTDGIFLGVFPRVAKTEQHYRRLLESEKSLLACINRLQQDLGRTPIKSVKEIYQQCDQQLLLTLPSWITLEFEPMDSILESSFPIRAWSRSGLMAQAPKCLPILVISLNCRISSIC